MALGARMVEFAGFEMPVQYSGIIEEHLAVRKRAGLFDVSHMGNVLVKGKDAVHFLQRVLTNNVERMKAGELKYTHILDEKGRILDDAIFYRLAEDEFFTIPNAATTEKMFNWYSRHAGEFSVALENRSGRLFCIALQGPKAQAIISRLTPADLSGVKLFAFTSADIAGAKAILASRSGYTGEDGFELVGPSAEAGRIWRALLKEGKAEGLIPVGLGARDTLRLEKGFLLSGQDFHDDRTPLEASADFVVKWDHDFIGKTVLEEQKAKGGYERLTPLMADGEGIPRHGYPVESGGKRVGAVTSGTFSPSLSKGIALAYLPPVLAAPGTPVVIAGRQPIPAKVVKLPFV